MVKIIVKPIMMKKHLKKIKSFENKRNDNWTWDNLNKNCLSIYKSKTFPHGWWSPQYGVL